MNTNTLLAVFPVAEWPELWFHCPKCPQCGDDADFGSGDMNSCTNLECGLYFPNPDSVWVDDWAGPALDTPQFDSLAWLAGQRWLVKSRNGGINGNVADELEKSIGVDAEARLLYEYNKPGLALYTAIEKALEAGDG